MRKFANRTIKKRVCSYFGLTIRFVLIFASQTLFAVEPIVVDNSLERINLGLSVDILEDGEKKWTIADVTSAENSKKFVKSPMESLNMGYGKQAYWLHFTLDNRADENKHWLLQVANPHLDKIDFYAIKKDDLKRVALRLSAGDSFKFSQRKIAHRFFIFSLLPPSAGVVHYYLRFESTSKLQAPLTIFAEKTFYSSKSIEHLLLGLSYGVILVMFLYNLFLFAALRDRSYLYYVTFIIGYLVLQMFLNGIAYEYLWPNSPVWNNRSGPFLGSFAIFWAVKFTQNFLETKKNAPKMHYILYGVMALNVLVMILALFSNIRLAYRLGVAVPLLFVAATLTVGIIVWKNGFRAARYFTLAWVVFLAGIVVYTLSMFAVIANNDVTNYGMQIGASIEMVMLSFALADRINIIEFEKEEAQKELIRTQRDSLDIQKKMAQSFSRFVPMQFLKFLDKKDIIDIELGDSVQKEMTVLFSDIRSFTSLSESMTPQENINFLNSYLRRINPVIRKNNGFIDKYIGDAIMALFADSPDDAISAGIDMLNELKLYNKHRKNQGYVPIRIGIGINTGNLMMGTIGDAERMEGTVIADAVNLASRLQDLTKIAHSNILISEESFFQIKDASKFDYRLMGRVRIRGKNQKVSIFEIFSSDNEEVVVLKKKTREAFESAIVNFFDNKLEDAVKQFESICTENPDDDAAQAYYKKCTEIIEKRLNV